MIPAVTFTPLAGLGDNYLQVSLLMEWASAAGRPVVAVFHHDGHVPPPEQRAQSAIHVQVELIELLAPHPYLQFACLPGHYAYPYDQAVVHAFSPSVMFDRAAFPNYWRLDRARFTPCGVPSRPYVAVAFDIVSYADLKALTAAESGAVIRRIRELGYEVVDVGGARPLADKAFVIDNAAAFVGCASGLAHVAAGLRKPCCVLMPEPDIPPFEWYTATLRHNGARYFDCLRQRGFDFDLGLAPVS